MYYFNGNLVDLSIHSHAVSELSLQNLLRPICLIIVPLLFEEKRRDTVFGFPWGVVRGSEFLVGTLSP